MFWQGDDGDVMEGGADADMFFVTDDEDSDLEEVLISDFQPEEDTLMVVQLDGLRSSSALSMVANPTGVLVSYEGRAVAMLEGLEAEDIPNISVSLSSLDGLDQAISRIFP